MLIYLVSFADVLISEATGGCLRSYTCIPTLYRLALTKQDSLSSSSLYQHTMVTQGADTELEYSDGQLVCMLAAIQNDQPTQKPVIIVNSKYPTSVNLRDLVDNIVENRIR